MKMLAKPVICACLAAATLSAAGFAHAPRGPGQDGKARRSQQQQVVPVREIERNVIPRVPGAQYLGFDYDSGDNVYTLKFLRNGSVIWVDVDGRTGDILRTRN